jgi:hypothetical protein
MDPELQKKIEAARAEGYTDEEINSYLGLSTGREQPIAQNMPAGPQQEPVDRRGEEKTAMLQGAAALGAGALATAAGGGLAYRAAKPLAKAAMVAMRSGMPPANMPAGPVAPPAAPAATPNVILDQYGRPMPASTPQAAPQAASQAARGPGLIDRTTQLMRQLAANRAIQTMAKGGGALAALTYSPELGPKVPQTGRMRGMEINPMTRRPWTPEQIATYEANPQQFDMQLPPAQMPR